MQPCHRALPDAQATAEVLLALIGLAQERGARTVAELVALSATRTRRVFDKRHLAFGAPPRPGVYLFRDRNDQVLYVGRARDLRARLRSYFRSERQRPAVEAALGAVERIEWRVLGSELEAALEELRLIRELRPPANARVARPDRYVWLRKRGDGVVASTQPTDASGRSARAAARSSRRARSRRRRARAAGARAAAPAPPAARARRTRAATRTRRGCATACEALERVCRELEPRRRGCARSQRCIVAPAAEPGHARAFFVAGGRVAAERTLPPGGGAHLEIEAGLAAARRALAQTRTGDLDELLLVGTFLRKPAARAADRAARDATRSSPPLVGRRHLEPPRAARRSNTGSRSRGWISPCSDLLRPVARDRVARSRACAAAAPRRGSASAARTGSACGSGRPRGGFAGLGRSPVQQDRLALRSTTGSGIGTAESSEIVYGCSGSS